MSKKTGRSISGDPRKSGGNIAGPGGPHDRNSVIVDTTNAVILDASTVTEVETLTGTPGLAMLLEGRIAKTTERARNSTATSPPTPNTRRLQHLLDTDAFTGEK